MEFDINKVYTVVNADEVKVGSIGYFADTMSILINSVTKEKYSKVTIKEILPPNYRDRFRMTNGYDYSLFYLVEEPKEVTADEWDNRPRLMKVWNNDYSKAKEYEVLAIRRASYWNFPVVVMTKDGNIIAFKHCLELETAKEAKEPAKKHHRPYRNIDEFITDFYFKKGISLSEMNYPMVWLKDVNVGVIRLITEYNPIDDTVRTGDYWSAMQELLEDFTYLDGSKCGIKEE